MKKTTGLQVFPVSSSIFSSKIVISFLINLVTLQSTLPGLSGAKRCNCIITIPVKRRHVNKSTSIYFKSHICSLIEILIVEKLF